MTAIFWCSIAVIIGVLGIVYLRKLEKWQRQGMEEGWDPDSPLHVDKYKPGDIVGGYGPK